MTRWLIIIAVHVCALWALSPTVLPEAAWGASERLRIDPELGGGITLRLDVQLAEVYRAELRRDVRGLAQDHPGVRASRDASQLLVPLADRVALSDTLAWLPQYEPQGVVTVDNVDYIGLAQSAEWREQIGALAIHQAEDRFLDMLDAQGDLGHSSVTREGSHLWLRSSNPDALSQPPPQRLCGGEWPW